MANKYVKSMIGELRNICGRRIGLIDEGGFIIAPDCPAEIDAAIDSVLPGCFAAGEKKEYAGFTFLAHGSRRSDFVSFAEGTDEEALKFCQVLGVAFFSMNQLYDERYDKANFIKNILLDNILPGDIFAKAKELHLSQDIPRIVLVVKVAEACELDACDIVEGMFPENNKDFVISIDDSTIVLVREVREADASAEAERIASSVADTLIAEAMTDVCVGIGTPAPTIHELGRSFKEARIALDVGGVFDNEKSVVSYNTLGIGRLIYQLPTTMCELFLTEIFQKDSLDSLDHETVLTIQKFFENNLNVSETSRQLYVHRNTLVYRLDKVQKITGLDLRIFDHAIVFKVAMMVKKYLDANKMNI
ncbi:MAG: helix-turn-helix domain-containing protein [Clostridia bacterium]|nr:helix-turn-helix domain-containing protein [Clostridia bacterium]